MNSKCVTIWHYRDAPKEYAKLSRHGGDEDWVLHCPAEMIGVYLPWGITLVLDGDEDSYLTGFGHVDRHILENGDIAVIFAHA
jgi:hypothetical protein